MEEKRKKREEARKAAAEKRAAAKGNKAAAVSPPPEEGCVIDNLLKEIRSGTTLRATARRSTHRGPQLTPAELQRLKKIAAHVADSSEQKLESGKEGGKEKSSQVSGEGSALARKPETISEELMEEELAASKSGMAAAESDKKTHLPSSTEPATKSPLATTSLSSKSADSVVRDTSTHAQLSPSNADPRPREGSKFMDTSAKGEDIRSEGVAADRVRSKVTKNSDIANGDMRPGDTSRTAFVNEDERSKVKDIKEDLGSEVKKKSLVTSKIVTNGDMGSKVENGSTENAEPPTANTLLSNGDEGSKVTESAAAGGRGVVTNGDMGPKVGVEESKVESAVRGKEALGESGKRDEHGRDKGEKEGEKTVEDIKQLSPTERKLKAFTYGEDEQVGNLHTCIIIRTW